MLSALGQRPFHEHILRHLSTVHGYRVASSNDVDKTDALLYRDLGEFHRTAAPHLLFLPDSGIAAREAMQQARRTRGIVRFLRDGWDYDGLHIPAIVREEGPPPRERRTHNVFTVVSDLMYTDSTRHSRFLDMLICLNGFPLVAITLSSGLSEHGLAIREHLWRTDQDPDTPLLRYGFGAPILLALTDTSVSMSTRLAGRATRFVNFDRHTPDGHSDALGCLTHHIWEHFLSPQTLVRMCLDMMYAEEESGFPLPSNDALVVPYVHQLNLLRVAKQQLEDGALKGRAHLVVHANGTGKTNSLLWLGRMLEGARSGELPEFDRVLIFSDPTTVRRHMVPTLRAMSIDHTPVAETVEELTSLIAVGERLILCTITRFGDLVPLLAGHRGALEKVDCRSSAVLLDSAITVAHPTLRTLVEDAAERLPLPTEGITLFGFTDSVSPTLLKQFGSGNTPLHTFSLADAIERSIVLNPLTYYIAHDLLTQVTYTGNDIPLVSANSSKQALTNRVANDPQVLEHRVKAAADHMLQHVTNMAAGRGKGMVLTETSADALLWILALQRLFARDATYSALRPLVSFAAPLASPGYRDIDDSSINGFPHADIPQHFHDDHNLLITTLSDHAFLNEPHLCALYLDREMEDPLLVRSINTLNRILPAKSAVTIMDFRRNTKRVQEAFAMALDGPHSSVDDEQRVPLAQLAHDIARMGVYRDADPRTYAQAVRSLRVDPHEAGAVREARRIAMAFRERMQDLREHAPDDAAAFAGLVAAFLREHVLQTQVGLQQDPALTDLAVYLADMEHLIKQSQNPIDTAWLDDLEVNVRGYKVRQETFSAIPRLASTAVSLADTLTEWHTHEGIAQIAAADLPPPEVPSLTTFPTQAALPPLPHSARPPAVQAAERERRKEFFTRLFFTPILFYGLFFAASPVFALVMWNYASVAIIAIESFRVRRLEQARGTATKRSSLADDVWISVREWLLVAHFLPVIGSTYILHLYCKRNRRTDLVFGHGLLTFYLLSLTFSG